MLLSDTSRPYRLLLHTPLQPTGRPFVVMLRGHADIVQLITVNIAELIGRIRYEEFKKTGDALIWFETNRSQYSHLRVFAVRNNLIFSNPIHYHMDGEAFQLSKHVRVYTPPQLTTIEPFRADFFSPVARNAIRPFRWFVCVDTPDGVVYQALRGPRARYATVGASLTYVAIPTNEPSWTCKAFTARSIPVRFAAGLPYDQEPEESTDLEGFTIHPEVK